MADASNNNSGNSGNSVSQQLQDIRDKIAEIPRPEKEASLDERREYKKTMADLSKQAEKLRKQEIQQDSTLDDKEKKILELYEKGVHVYGIALQVFDFANTDTVGKVVLTLRKAYTTDFQAIETVESTKGYTGVGVAH
jgi:regulator of replication initiation timing